MDRYVLNNSFAIWCGLRSQAGHIQTYQFFQLFRSQPGVFIGYIKPFQSKYTHCVQHAMMFIVINNLNSNLQV